LEPSGFDCTEFPDRVAEPFEGAETLPGLLYVGEEDDLPDGDVLVPLPVLGRWIDCVPDELVRGLS